MQLPLDLVAALDGELAGAGTKALERAAAQLSQAYRGGASSVARVLRTADERLAYLAVRLPATFAAVTAALRATLAQVEGPIHSVLDLGAGPGTAAWVATTLAPEIETLTLLEREREWLSQGRRLFAGGAHPALGGARWVHADLGAVPELEAHDLVVASYVLGELPEQAARSLVQAALAATRKALVLIEPGTPAGFARVRMLRDSVLQQGQHVLAPCPHGGPCPMSGADWCHFAARVERSALHRRLKGAALGHEDEKFAYVAVSPRPVALASARIVRHPLVRGGHATLDLCTPAGLERRTVTKRDRASWRLARRARWGDAWEPEANAVAAGADGTEPEDPD